ncbi:hypothetical protein JW905_07585, partial [bacterium]|nr:hypothetical protein [candidate division CSSED10-310 bacterium]
PEGGFIRLQSIGGALPQDCLRAAKAYFRAGAGAALSVAAVPLTPQWQGTDDILLDAGFGHSVVALWLDRCERERPPAVQILRGDARRERTFWECLAVDEEEWSTATGGNIENVDGSMAVDEFLRAWSLVLPWSDSTPGFPARLDELARRIGFRAALWQARRHDRDGLVAHPVWPEHSAEMIGALPYGKADGVTVEVAGPSLLVVRSILPYPHVLQSQLQSYDLAVFEDETQLAAWRVTTAPDTVEDAAGRRVLRDADGFVLGRRQEHALFIPPGRHCLSLRASRPLLLSVNRMEDRPHLFEPHAACVLKDLCGQALRQCAAAQAQAVAAGRCRYISAMAKLVLGRPAEVATDLARLPELTGEPSDRLLLAALLRLRGQARTALRQWSDAADDFHGALGILQPLTTDDSFILSVQPGWISAILMDLAALHAAGGDLGLAVAAGREALEYAPDDSSAMTCVADWIAGSGNRRLFPEAMDLYQRVLAADPAAAAAGGYWNLVIGAGAWRSLQPDLGTGMERQFLDTIRPVGSRLDRLEDHGGLAEMEGEFLGRGIWFPLLNGEMYQSLAGDRETGIRLLAGSGIARDTTIAVAGEPPFPMCLETTPADTEYRLVVLPVTLEPGFHRFLRSPSPAGDANVPPPSSEVLINLAPVTPMVPLTRHTYQPVPVPPEPALQYTWETPTATSLRGMIRFTGGPTAILGLTLDGQYLPVRIQLAGAAPGQEPVVFYLDVPAGAHVLTVHNPDPAAALLLTLAIRSWRTTGTASPAIVPDLAASRLREAAGTVDDVFTRRWFSAVDEIDPAAAARLAELTDEVYRMRLGHPDLARALLARARLLALMGRLDLAQHDLRAAYRRVASDPTLLAAVTREYALTTAAAGSTSEAENAFAALTAKGDLDAEAALGFGWWLLQNEREQEAADIFRMLSTAIPGSVWVRLGLARSMAAAGDLAGALGELEHLPVDSCDSVCLRVAARLRVTWLLRLCRLREAAATLAHFPAGEAGPDTWAELLREDVQPLLDPAVEAILRDPGVQSQAAGEEQVPDAASAFNLAARFNSLWYLRSPFPRLELPADEDIRRHGRKCHIMPLDAPESASIYYEINRDAPMELLVRGPATLCLAVRPEHLVDQDGKAVPSARLRLRIEGIDTTAGELVTAFPLNPPSADAAVREYATAIPGVREDVMVPIAGGDHRVLIEAAQGAGYVRPEVAVPHVDEPLLGGEDAAYWRNLAARCSAQTGAHIPGAPATVGGVCRLADMLRAAFDAWHGAESAAPGNSFTTAAALFREILECQPACAPAAAGLARVDSRIERRVLTGLRGGVITVEKPVMDQQDPDVVMRGALVPRLPDQTGGLLLAPWQVLTLRTRLAAPAPIGFRFLGWSVSPFLESRDAIRGSWSVTVKMDGVIVGELSGGNGVIRELLLEEIPAGEHEIDISRERMTSTVPLRLSVSSPAIAGGDPVPPRRTCQYSSTGEGGLSAGIIGPNTLYMEARSLAPQGIAVTGEDDGAARVLSAALMQEDRQVAALDTMVSERFDPTAHALQGNRSEGPLGLPSERRLLVPAGRHVLNLRSQGGQQIAVRLWAESDREIPTMIAPERGRLAAATRLWSAPPPWERHPSARRLTAPVSTGPGTFEMETMYTNRQRSDEEADLLASPADLFDASLAYRMHPYNSRWYLAVHLEGGVPLDSANEPLLGTGAELDINRLPAGLRLRLSAKAYTQETVEDRRSSAWIGLDLRRSWRLTPRFLIVPGLLARGRWQETEESDWTDQARPDLRIFSRYADDHPTEFFAQNLFKYEPFDDLVVYSLFRCGSGGRSDVGVMSNWRSYTGIKAFYRGLILETQYRAVDGLPGDVPPVGLERHRISTQAEYHWWTSAALLVSFHVSDAYYPQAGINAVSAGVRLLFAGGGRLSDLDPNSIDFYTELSEAAPE